MNLYFLLIIYLSIIYPYYRKNAFKLTIESNSILQFFYVYESTFNDYYFLFLYVFNYLIKICLQIFYNLNFFVCISRISFIIFNLFNIIPNLFLA